MPVKHFKVEKVPLSYLPASHTPSFPSFPILYMELLENKEKVLPHLKDKAHEPIFLNSNSVNHIAPIDDNKEFFTSVTHERDIRSKLNERLKHADPIPRKYEDDRKSVRERTMEHERDIARVKELSHARQKEVQRTPTYKPSPSVATAAVAATTSAVAASAAVSSAYSGDKTETNIRSILGGSGGGGGIGGGDEVVQHPLPPTLSEINQTQQHHQPIKNFAYTNTDDEMKRKRELLFRFDILKRSYKEAHIPEFTEYTDIQTMERIYEDTVRKVGLESKVEGYKKFLTMGFFGVEFVFTKFMGLDMSGFAKQQMSSMNSYERLLIELGEKAMIEKSKSQWPVELRLLFTIVMNAVIFLLMKSVMNGGITSLVGGAIGSAMSGGGGGGGGGDGGGMMSGIMNMMSGLTGGGGGGGSGGSGGGGGGMLGGLAGLGSSSSSAAPVKPKQKMKGPSIVLDDTDKKTN